MASFSLRYKPAVEKDLAGLPRKQIARVIAKIDALAVNPFPHGALKLSGAERLYRLRVGDYRVVYEVDSANKAVVVHYVRHRREAYR